jgi:hypothetical protein
VYLSRLQNITAAHQKRLDEDSLGFLSAVSISFLTITEQKLVDEIKISSPRGVPKYYRLFHTETQKSQRLHRGRITIFDTLNPLLQVGDIEVYQQATRFV